MRSVPISHSITGPLARSIGLGCTGAEREKALTNAGGLSGPHLGVHYTSCRAEFDEQGLEMKLVSGPPTCAGSVGQTHTFGNWHRLVRNLPSEEEEAKLRKEIDYLTYKSKEETSRLVKAEQERRIARATTAGTKGRHREADPRVGEAEFD